MSTGRTRLAVLATSGILATAGLAATAGAAEAATVPACGNSSLAVTSTYVDSGAGHSWMSLIYRNKGTATCTVYGYPGLDAVNSSGHVLAHAARTPGGYGGGGTLSTVTIKPGSYASASVEWLNFNGGTGGACTFATAIDTVVANTTQVHRLPVPVSVCGLQVHPTVTSEPGYLYYGPAQHNWIVGASVDAADTDVYLSRAKSDLQLNGNYPTQVAELAQLISFPNTSLTPAQIAAAHADVAALDRFFATPGLYS